LRLSDFKAVLIKAGFRAEVAGGAVVVNDVLVVRRNAANMFSLEGAVCPDYYRVRALLYEQFAIL
jgi:cleavage and polyadenylation specificity factor subunit 2